MQQELLVVNEETVAVLLPMTRTGTLQQREDEEAQVVLSSVTVMAEEEELLVKQYEEDCIDSVMVMTDASTVEDSVATSIQEQQEKHSDDSEVKDIVNLSQSQQHDDEEQREDKEECNQCSISTTLSSSMDHVTFYGSWPWQRGTESSSLSSSPHSSYVSNVNDTVYDEMKLSEHYTKQVQKYARKRLDKSKVESYYQSNVMLGGVTVSVQPQEKDEGCYFHKASPSFSGSNIVSVTHQDLQLGDLLGQGSFSSVYSVKMMNSSSSIPLLQQEETKLVIKVIRSKLLKKPAMLAACVADLIKEGLLLASCKQPNNNHHQDNMGGGFISSHPGQCHIVQVYGWTPTMITGYANGRHDAFFLLLEKLDYTLTKKLDYWRHRYVDVESIQDMVNAKHRNQQQQHQQQKKGLLKFWKASKNNTTLSSTASTTTCQCSRCLEYQNLERFLMHVRLLQFWMNRLQLVVDLANAVEFLHAKGILHRDLKPDNIGFVDDQGLTGNPMGAGCLKVFDFDVARLLHHAQPGSATTSNDASTTNVSPVSTSYSNTLPLYKLTRRVGSPRYMSPECARGDNYNELSDVYAVGLLAFELLTLIKPYHDIAAEDHDQKIFFNGTRPTLPPVMGPPMDTIAAATKAQRQLQQVNYRFGKERSSNEASSGACIFSNTGTTISVNTFVAAGMDADESAHVKQPNVQFWNANLQSLIRHMWNEDIANRPTMTHARQVLQQELDSVQQQLEELQLELEHCQHSIQNQPQEQPQTQQDDLLKEECQEVPIASSQCPQSMQPQEALSSSSSTRRLPFRLWKSKKNITSSSNKNIAKGWNKSLHRRTLDRSSSSGSIMGTTRHTTSTTAFTTSTGTNFSSFNNLAALNHNNNHTNNNDGETTKQ